MNGFEYNFLTTENYKINTAEIYILHFILFSNNLSIFQNQYAADTCI